MAATRTSETLVVGLDNDVIGPERGSDLIFGSDFGVRYAPVEQNFFRAHAAPDADFYVWRRFDGSIDAQIVEYRFGGFFSREVCLQRFPWQRRR